MFSSRLYPLFVDLSDRRVLVVGGGAVAERKVRALIDTGARIQIVAETLSSGLEALVESDEAVWRRTKFAGAMLDAVWLVIAATGDRDLNRRIADAARARRVFINVVDDAALSSFHVPALIHRAPVQVAISSGGTAPALATAIRERLEASLDESLGSLATLLGRWRTRIKSAFPDLIRRRAFYRHVLKGTAGKAIRAGQTWAAESVISSLLKEQSSTDPPPSGWVALVGAGPGDAGLLTLRGLRLLGEADVILHDRLVSDEVLALARRDAEFMSVAKRAGEGGGSQARINALMVEHASAGRFVVRLKGGDPFVFGRGGEELEYLREHGIAYEVVPGITAAVGCAAYAGVPLTHRDHAHSLHWISGHDDAALDDALLVGEQQTLVVYMGVAQLGKLADKLITEGRSPATPFALIENGTTPRQRVVAGQLFELAQQAHDHDVQPPALLIIGEVAALAPRLAWFQTDALFTSSQAPVRAVA